MRFISFSILLFVFAFSCNNTSDLGNKLTINKGRYKIIDEKGGEKANPGDYIIYSVLFKDNNDKVFMDKRDKNHLLREQVLRDTAFYKDLTAVSEVLYKLAKGDSAIITVPLTEDQKIQELKNSDTIFFFLKVVDIVDPEGMRDIIEDEFLKQDAEATEARIKQIAIDQTIMKTWDDYNKGKLKNKLKYTKTGIKYIILEDGKGEKAKLGEKVKFGFYGMTHKDASAFENSFGRDKDLELIVGDKKVIVGWDEALQEMNEGMKAVFFIPAKLGFGKEGLSPIIPPNSDLVFYIEMHKIYK